MTRQEAIERLKAVLREQRVAALAVRHFHATSSVGQRALAEEKLEPGDLRVCSRNLETTYVVRLFAEFEACLRSYWRDERRRKSWNTIGVEALIQGVGAYRDISPGFVAEAQEVRRFRNALVHVPETAASLRLALDECASRLGRYLSYLPLRW